MAVAKKKRGTIREAKNNYDNIKWRVVIITCTSARDYGRRVI
jgi:hypothetical protein